MLPVYYERLMAYGDGGSRRWWLTTSVIACGIGVFMGFAGVLLATELDRRFGGPAFLVWVLSVPAHVTRIVEGDNVHSSWFLPSFLGSSVVMWSPVALPVVARLRRWVSS